MKHFYGGYQFKNNTIVIGTPRITNLIASHLPSCHRTTVRHPLWLLGHFFIPSIIVMNRILVDVI